jgi:hypothetical protein
MLAALVIGSGWVASLAQEQTPNEPPVPYEDIGACPFECCVYREWIANAAVTVLRERRMGSEAAFTLNKGDRVQAITGVVVTRQPGRVRFRTAVDLWTTSARCTWNLGRCSIS